MRLKMFQFKRYMAYIMACLLTAGLSGCREEDVDVPGDDVPEGMAKLTLLIPDYNGGGARFNTRAYNTDEEGYMSNLYVVAIKYSSYDEIEDDAGVTEVVEHPLPTPQVFTYSLNSIGESFEVDEKYPNGTDRYHQFNVTLYPGKYKFAVVANVDLYLARTSKIYNFTKESDFQNIVLNFKEDVALSPLHLPMLCPPWKIKYSYKNGTISNVDPEDPFVEIRKGNDAQIYANMEFQCAKVRYTILFDKTEGGISESFGDSWIRFNVDDTNKPTAHNIRQQTKLVPDEYGKAEGETGVYDENQKFIPKSSDPNDFASWIMSIDRYYWSGPEWSATDPDWSTNGKSHGTEYDDYPKTPNSTLDFFSGSTASWIPMKQKVWQGVVYLPENLPEEGKENEFEATYLEFPYHTRANDWDDTKEQEAKTPKKILLFGNNNETHYTSSSASADYVEDPSKPFKGIERGYFYDVVAKIINPEQDMQIQVFVSIIPWHEIDQNVDDSLMGDGTSTDVNGAVDPFDYDRIESEW